MSKNNHSEDIRLSGIIYMEKGYYSINSFYV